MSVDHKAKGDCEVDPPTELEQATIRELVDNWVVAVDGRINCLHISEDGKPYCPRNKTKELGGEFASEIHWKIKPVAVYPPGYKPICSHCLRLWRAKGLPDGD